MGHRYGMHTNLKALAIEQTGTVPKQTGSRKIISDFNLEAGKTE